MAYGDGALAMRAKAVNYLYPPYASRYPALVRSLSDGWGEPVGHTIDSVAVDNSTAFNHSIQHSPSGARTSYIYTNLYGDLASAGILNFTANDFSPTTGSPMDSYTWSPYSQMGVRTNRRITRPEFYGQIKGTVYLGSGPNGVDGFNAGPVNMTWASTQIPWYYELVNGIVIEHGNLTINSSGNFTIQTTQPTGSVLQLRIGGRPFMSRLINNVMVGTSGTTLSLWNGDIDNDNTSSVYDLAYVTNVPPAGYLGLNSSGPEWLIPDESGVRPYDADVNGDGFVDALDAAIVTQALNANATGE